MAKSPFLIVLIIILIVGFLFYWQAFKPSTRLHTINLQIKNKTFQLEIAQTPGDKAKGLSGRTSLCSDCGMIFTFDHEAIYPFWMKDTLIPLDLIWLDSSGEIVTILQAAPEPNTPFYQLKNYTNTKPASYVIELNVGNAHKLGLQIGDIIDLSPVHNHAS